MATLIIQVTKVVEGINDNHFLYVATRDGTLKAGQLEKTITTEDRFSKETRTEEKKYPTITSMYLKATKCITKKKSKNVAKGSTHIP